MKFLDRISPLQGAGIAILVLCSALALTLCSAKGEIKGDTLGKDGVSVYEAPRKVESAEFLFKSSRTYEKSTRKDKGCSAVNVIVKDSPDSVWIDYNGLTIAYLKVAVNPNNKNQIIIVDSSQKPYKLTLAEVSEKEGEPNPRIWLFIETAQELTVLSEQEECETLKLKLN